MTTERDNYVYPGKGIGRSGADLGHGQGMALRDYFAAHCPEYWVKLAFENTVGGIRDALIERDLIPKDAIKKDAFRSYSQADLLRLHAALRYEYADVMLATRRS